MAEVERTAAKLRFGRAAGEAARHTVMDAALGNSPSELATIWRIVPMQTQIVAAMLLGIALFPSAASATTLNQLLGWCGSGDSGDDRLCTTYLSTALNLLRSPDPVLNAGHQVCAPTDNPRKTVIPILSSWSKQHPESGDNEQGLSVMGEALIGHYPCK
jgi:hypothetical protein